LVIVIVSILSATSFFPEIEARLHAAGALDRKLGLGQVDLVRGEHELRLGPEHVGELEIDWRAAGRQVDQSRVSRRASIRPLRGRTGWVRRLPSRT
jgi:hypothetical protein